jgi:O-antigen ligase
MRVSSYAKANPAAVNGSGLTGNPARDLANSFNVRVLLFLSAHIPLALAMEYSPWLSTAHAALVLLIGLRAALLGRASQVIYTVAYVAAAEVLWRMSRAYVFWEFAKYAIILIVFVAILTDWRRDKTAPRLRTIRPLLLLVAVLPAIALTILEVGPVEARDPISFNLSGHLAIVALAFYLWGRVVDRPTAIRMFLAIMAPVTGIAFLAVYYIVRGLDTLTFFDASNWITSGSFGPNQVSNILGFGALAGALLFILMTRARGARAFVALLTLIMLVQGLLTLSRGGVYSLVLALAVLGFHLLNTPRARGRFLLLFALFGVVLAVGVYPALDQFTEGIFSQRFRDLDTTGRLEVAEADIQAFSDYPLLGVGVGQSDRYHVEYLGYEVASHTEYTRLLAEHGLFGILLFLALISMLGNRYLANRPGLDRAVTAALATWGLSVMAHTAMRSAAISLALTLGLVMWQLRQTTEDDEPAAEPSEVGRWEPPG